MIWAKRRAQKQRRRIRPGQPFNQKGLDALLPRHGGGFQSQYREAEKARILREFERQPDLEQGGTATWSLPRCGRPMSAGSACV